MPEPTTAVAASTVAATASTGFLTGVLQNNFMHAMGWADYSWDGRSFTSLAKWLSNYPPPESYGSPEAMSMWMAKDPLEMRDIMIEFRLRPSEFDILRGVAIA